MDHGQELMPRQDGTPNQQTPSTGRIVRVKTHGKLINGQDEHAGLVTQVFGDTPDSAINVTYFPGDGSTAFASSIFLGNPDQTYADGTVTWRWPLRG